MLRQPYFTFMLIKLQNVCQKFKNHAARNYLHNHVFVTVGQTQDFKCTKHVSVWLKSWSLFVLSLTCALCVVLMSRGRQYVAQTATPASILHAPGRSERWQQLCLRPLVGQSPQLLQLLRYFHEPLSIQQPHECCRQRALPTGQSNQLCNTFKYL